MIELFINASLLLLGLLIGIIGTEMWYDHTFEFEEIEDNRLSPEPFSSMPMVVEEPKTELGAVTRPDVEQLDKQQHPIKQQEEDVWDEIATEIKGLVA